MEITIIVAILGLFLSVLTFFVGIKRNSNTDVGKRAYFEGEIRAKLDQLLNGFEKLDNKLTKNTRELHDAIDKKLLEHEQRYHNK